MPRKVPARLRRWVRAATAAAVVDAAAVAVLAVAAVGVFGVWPQQQSHRLAETAEAWHERASELGGRALGADQPVCAPVPAVPGTAPPTAVLEPMPSPNTFKVTVTGTECAWVDFNLARGPDLHYLWTFPPDGSGAKETLVWAADDMTAPFTLTAVGAGGSTVTTGEFRFQQS